MQLFSRYFNSSLIAICFIYLIFELFFIPHTKFSVDEFWFAHHIFDYTKHLPYRDFSPYKTILGYYLLTIPMWFSEHIINTLFYIKYEIVIINTIVIFFLGKWAKRYFSPQAILLTLTVMMSSLLFLVYSAELRVDLLACWLALFSFLFILGNRLTLGGLLLGISFLISQKVIWFWIATNIALVLTRLIKNLVLFNLAWLIPIIIYFCFWSFLSTPDLVFKSMFYEAYTQAKITWYSEIYYFAWKIILSNGPLFILLLPVTATLIFISQQQQTKLILIYSWVVMLFLLTYQQPFPYNIVLGIPAFFVLYAEFFTKIFKQPLQISLSGRSLFWLLSLSAIAITGIILALDLPIAYLIIISIPIALGFYSSHMEISRKIIFLTVFLVGIFFPLTRFILTAFDLNNHYQKSILINLNNLLGKEEFYVAGSPLLFNKNELIPGLKNLIGPALEYLYHPLPTLEPLMLNSLNLDRRTSEQVIKDLEDKPVKLYVNNERMKLLPYDIRRFLLNHYDHLWGSIYIYAPPITMGMQKINIKFTGNYLIKAASSGTVHLDNLPYKTNDIVHLNKGIHYSKAKLNYNLKLIPNCKLDMLTDEEDRWYDVFKQIMT